MEKVSVIIALYNAENFIADTLNSVVKQTYQNIEIIVVNDGSKDGSSGVVENLNIPNLRWFNRTNAGQCASSNFGFQQATGDLIKFLDADDLLEFRCIEKMVLKSRENPNRLVFGEWHYFVDDINYISFNKSPIYKDYENSLDWYLDTLNFAGSMLAGWMWLIPRNILEKAGGWDEKLHLMNDFEFSTRLILHSDGIGFADGAIHYYRKGLKSAMTSKMNDRIALSIFTGVNKAFQNVMEVENSTRTRAAFANQFQKWVYQFYPEHKALANKMEVIIKELGGSTLSPPGGSLFRALNKGLPWKTVAKLQFVLHRSIWKPLLKLKHDAKLKKQYKN